jgi:hypothetical protein
MNITMKHCILLVVMLCSMPTMAQPDNAQLSVWANEAIIATYTFDYKNLLDQQKQIAKYFSSTGWIAYSKALADSKLLDAVQKNAYYVSAVATSPPKLTVLDPTHWIAVMPILVVYENPQYQQKQHLQVTINFTVAPAGQGVRGFSILSLQSSVTTPPCECKIDNANANNGKQ